MATQRGDSYSKVLDSAVRLSRAVVRECTRNRFSKRLNFWTFALIAKMASSAASIHCLVRNGHTSDAKLILRSVLDAVVDLLYIAHDPLQKKRLMRLFVQESNADAYERLKFYGEHMDIDIKEFLNRYPNFRTLVEDHENARKHRASQIAAGMRPKRWRDITTHEKVKALDRFKKASAPLAYTVRDLANAHAHCRPAALYEFLKPKEDGIGQVEFKPHGTDFLYSPDVVCLETAVCLLLACDHVVDGWYLGGDWSKRVQRVFDRLHRLKGKSKR